MIKIGNNILQMDKPNGTFIVFCEYDSEDVFSDFLKYIHDNFGAKVTDIKQQLYLNSAKIIFSFGEATAIFQDGIGCAIRIDKGEGGVVKNIVERCSFL